MPTNRYNRPRSAVVPGFYSVHHGDVFLPGAGNIVFEPRFSLPILKFIGPATQAGNSPTPKQPPQMFVTRAAPVTGFGGLVAGQFITQPLSEPGNGNQ